MNLKFSKLPSSSVYDIIIHAKHLKKILYSTTQSKDSLQVIRHENLQIYKVCSHTFSQLSKAD
jgi:hypothetical protein